MIESEEFMNASKRFESGDPVKAVDVNYLRTAWERWNEFGKKHPNTSLGAAVMGLDDGEHTAEQAHAAWIRLMLLNAMVERGVLSTYVNAGKPVPELFLAAATMPCTKEDLAEAMIQRTLLAATPEAAAQSKHEMQVGGYDPDHPMIDGKFLEWVGRGK